MSIPFATGFESHELEDRVIASLTSEGFTLSFRALSPLHLREYLSNLGDDQRILLVCEENFKSEALSHISSGANELALMVIDSFAARSVKEIIDAAHEALRKPNISKTKYLRQARRRNWIGVFGTSGSPGISSISLNLAAELSQHTSTHIVDADIRNQDLHILLGARREGRSVLTPSLSFMTIANDQDRINLMSEPSQLCVLDIGESPSLHDEVFTDRRSSVRDSLDLITQSHNLVYILQPENRALTELDAFLTFAERELSHHEITFLLNKMGSSNRHKAILRSLKNRIADRALFVLPQDNALFDRAKARYATLGEVGARSSARRTIAELSIYLAKSF